MPSHGSYYHTGSNHHSRRRSTRRSSDASRLYTSEDSAKILDASREALKQAQRRHVRRHSGGYYYTIPRAETPEIPSYETFLAEARARVDSSNRPDSGTTRSSDPAHHLRQDLHGHHYQFYPNPYLYGYPSGYYSELRAPLHHTDSARTGKSARSSTLVGSDTQNSPTLVDSGRTSLERSHTVRAAHNRQSYPRQSHRRQQTRVSWGPTSYTWAEPAHVSSARSPTHKPTASLPLSISAPVGRAEAVAWKTITQPSFSVARAQVKAPKEKEKQENHSSSTHSQHFPHSTSQPLNLSPSLFIRHETYLVTDSAIQNQCALRARANRAKLDALIRNALRGSAGAGSGGGVSVSVSKWSPDSAPDAVPLQNLFRRFSVGRSEWKAAWRKREKKAMGDGRRRSAPAGA